MIKPTLKDFVNHPILAIKHGFYPGFPSVLYLLTHRAFNLKRVFKFIFSDVRSVSYLGSISNILKQYLIIFLKIIDKICRILFFYVFFPIILVICYCLFMSKFKKHHGNASYYA